MKKLTLITFILFFASTALGQEISWSKYIPEKQRKPIINDCLRNTGLKGVLYDKSATAIWVTDQAARVLVSQAIDRERLTNEQADALFSRFRPKDSFLILIVAEYLYASKYPEELPDPLSKNEIFLQRSEDTKQFSKGILQNEDFDIQLRGLFRTPKHFLTHRILFPRQTRDNVNLIRSLDDQIDLQFVLERKKFTFEYKLKDVVKNLEDL
jgi:hypothetical protein